MDMNLGVLATKCYRMNLALYTSKGIDRHTYQLINMGIGAAVETNDTEALQTIYDDLLLTEQSIIDT